LPSDRAQFPERLPKPEEGAERATRPMGLLETARKSVKDDGKGNPHELQRAHCMQNKNSAPPGLQVMRCFC